MADNNIGASRLIGTNGLQQAVSSLTSQVNKMAQSIANASSAFNNMSGSAGRATGGSRTGNSWNSNSNRMSYSPNGGGGSFSGGGFGSTANGGGAAFAGAVGMAAGVAAGLTNYGNRNMSDNMQRDMFNSYSNVAGGGRSSLARHMVFDNNNLALSTTDAGAAAYTNAFVYGNAQFGGRANPNFQRGFTNTQGFGYASPTLGATAAANAAQQTYTARALMMSQGLGIRPTIGVGGVKTSMGDIAQSIYQKTFGGRAVDQRGFNASISQGGSLGVNLRYMGKQMGWDSTTIQEYQNYLQGMNAAENNGMSRAQYQTFSEQASQGNKNAINTLAKTTGLGSSMFEHQRNLNATRNTRANDILDSLAPAFNKATDVVNDFSAALTSFLKNTGLDKAIGTGAGWGSALSSSLGGFSGGFGAMGGVMMGARMFGAGGGLGGLRGMGGMGGGGGIINAARGAGGAFNITSLGGAASGGSMLARGGPYGLAAAAVGGSAWLGWNSANNDTGGSFGDAMKITGLFGNPLGGAALGGSWARRAWDKWWTGKNKESFGSMFNPLGKEKRMTSTDGRAGGSRDAPSGGGSSGGGGTGTANSGATAAQVIQFAQSQLGVPYVWGGTSPGKGLDCSGLIQWAFGQAGVKLPRVSQDQAKSGTGVPVNDAQPGDLLFNKNASHVVMALGGGRIIEAPRTGLNVRIRNYTPGEFSSARRILGSVGDTGSLLNNNTGDSVKNTLSNSQSRSGGNIGSLGGTSEASAIASALASSVGSMPMGAKTASGTSGTSPLGQTPNGNGGNDKASLQAYAKQLLGKYGWGNQWNDFDALVMSESSWDVHATNKSSGAYGLPQALPASKLASAGSDWQSSGETQLRWMMDYVKGRYGSPSKAWSFHQKNNWYAAGAWDVDKDQNATVHQGEMIIPAKQAESIRQVLLNNSFNPGMQRGSGSGSGINIGAIQVQLPSGWSGTKQEAQAIGKSILDAVENDSRVKRLQRGN